MIISLDNTILSPLLHPEARFRPNPATNEPAPHSRERIDSMVDMHSAAGDTIIIPAPCLSELLVVVPDLVKAIDEINRTTVFQIEEFGARAAIELAEMQREAHASGDKRGGVDEAWQKIKLDRQIVATAKTAGARIFYTDDSAQANFARAAGMKVIHTWDIELSLSHAQFELIDK